MIIVKTSFSIITSLLVLGHSFGVVGYLHQILTKVRLKERAQINNKAQIEKLFYYYLILGLSYLLTNKFIKLKSKYVNIYRGYQKIDEYGAVKLGPHVH